MQFEWVLIPIIAILVGGFKDWLKIRARQQALGASNKELERDLEEIRKERSSLLQRLENLEAIVVSQTWEALHDHSLPPQEKELKVASTVRRELGTAAEPSYQQRAGELARRLQG